MGEELIQKLIQVLGELGYHDNEVHLETTPSGKVGGHIVSSAFKGMSQLERQDDLWDELKQRLTEAEQNRIVAILTVTPEEIADE